MDGIVIIDKPAGWTSHDVVARVRRILGERRIGHTGTLDPLATGVLVVLVGRATRLARFLAGAQKEYEAVIRFGYATETGDATGAPRHASPTGGRECSMWSEDEIEAALESLCGEIEQVPPMYSAKKVRGKKLYELARQGVEIERQPVRVVVYQFQAERENGTLLRQMPDGTCELSVRVICSAGTYIRALAESVGERLGVGAHLSALRRTRAGEFRIENAITVDNLKEMAEANQVVKILLSPEAALSRMPFVHLTDSEARRVRHGAPVWLSAPPQWKDGESVRIRDKDGNLIGIGVYIMSSGQLQPRIMFIDEEKI